MSDGVCGPVWNIVLAAGDGNRMKALTRALYGTDLPKQFAAFDGGLTLLQRTIERTGLIGPADRTVVVVAERHAELARGQLAGSPEVEIVPQPLNLGTGPGVLLPLSRVLARDARAQVLLFPADHHFARPDGLVDAARRALEAAALAPSGVALVGVPAERAATDLGWIVPGRRLGPASLGARVVSRFAEKPDEAVATQLLAEGGLWNTLIVAGSARALWQLGQLHLPRQVSAMEWLRNLGDLALEPQLLRALYARLDRADFSRDVLERAENLAVVRMADSGWSDCGTPERLLETMETTPQKERLLEHIRAFH